MKRIVIIGRSGSGKSTLIRKLQEAGIKLPVIEETARKILTSYPFYSTQQKHIKMLEQQYILEEIELDRDGGFISDRGLHDYVVFSTRAGMNPRFYVEQLFKRYDWVFKMPNKPFTSDQIRVERSEQEAQTIQNQIDALYRQTGHNPVNVPDSDARTQATFIKRFLR
jgi:predicted ATPase